MNADARGRDVLTLSVLAFTGGLGGGVVFPILPLLGLQLGIPALLIGLILAINRITRLAVNPLTGILVDRLGARWPLILGLVVETFSTLCFYAGVHEGHAAAWFLGGRALWGIGSSLLMVGVLTAALIFSDTSIRGLATAKVRMSLSLGVPAGLVLGGVVASALSAGAAFLTAAAITFIGAVLALRIAPSGTARATSALTNTAQATVPSARQLLRRGSLWIIWLFNFFVFFAVQGVILASLVLLVHDRDLALSGWGTEGTAGGLMAIMIGASAAMSWLAGKRVDRTRRRAPVVITGALVLIGGFALLAISRHTGSTAISLGLIGAGAGGASVPLILLIGELVPAASYGRAIGIYQVFGDFGGSLGPIIGLEAMQRMGATGTLMGATAMLTVTLVLAGLLWRYERPQTI